MVDYQDVFIKNLKKFRKSQNITQSELAELCDVSNGTVGNIECGVTKPSFDLLLKFAEKLQVQPGDFFRSEEDVQIVNRRDLEKLEKSIISFIAEEFKKIS